MLDCVQSMTGLRRPEAQNLLGRFLFSGWEAHEKPVTALSGGERRRLALALVVASGANFLVLDEPTNHLDLESREALEAALENFPGTVLLVSHDRACSTRSPTGCSRSSTERCTRTTAAGPSTPSTATSRRKPPRSRGPQGEPSRGPSAAPRPSELEQLEGRISRQEEAVAELERRLADDWSDVDALAAHRQAREELQSLLSRWERLFEEAQA